jgi:tetratricopeptide (TPR) repeat protein
VRLIACATMCCLISLASIRAYGQARVVDPTGLDRSLYGADYFTAPSNPKMRAWLALVEGRHASEVTWAAFRDGKISEAEGDCMYTLERFVNHPGALHLLTQIAEVKREPSMPIAHFERALEAYPRHAYTHAQYGHYLVGIGARAAGIAELRTALQLEPTLLQARLWLAAAENGGTAGGGVAATMGGPQADSLRGNPAR